MIFILFMFILFMFTGCNYSLGLGSYNFEHIHFFDKQQSYCATVEKWFENDTGIEVKTKEYGSIFLSEGTYILFEDDCPFCS